MAEEFDFGSLLEKDEPEEKPKSVIPEEIRKHPIVKEFTEMKDNLTSDKPATRSKRPRPKTTNKQLHILTEENLIIFIKQTNKSKSYEMKHRFYNSSSFEIQQLLDKLFQKGQLKRNKNGWISLRPDTKY